MNTETFFTSTVGILLILFGIFQIILMIKIWMMTNDVSEIHWLLFKQAQAQAQEKEPKTNERPFEIGDHVVRISDGKQMVISKIKKGKYICTTDNGFNGFFQEGEYDAKELRLFK
jgi:uncharacterized protein YodC (DUF2158 family)